LHTATKFIFSAWRIEQVIPFSFMSRGTSHRSARFPKWRSAHQI